MVIVTKTGISIQCGKYYDYLSQQIQLFPANLPKSIFPAKYWCHATPPTNFPWIRTYTIPIYCCTTHYSSVTFWSWFCLDLKKVIALAHLAIISTNKIQGVYMYAGLFDSRNFPGRIRSHDPYAPQCIRQVILPANTHQSVEISFFTKTRVEQGDQIGRIFPIANLGNFFNYRSSPNFGLLFPR
jgi:hypothetical protein